MSLTAPAMASAKTEIDMGEFKCTAYCPCEKCSDHWGRRTATQTCAEAGRTVAVDPDVIAYGTVLMVGDHEYVAEDCGAHVKGDHVDIFMDTHEEVEAFGKKYKNVWITGRK